MEPQRSEILLKIRPWFRDHGVEGRTVLPAVETLRVLAAEARTHAADIRITTMKQARFARFLELPPDREEIPLVVERQSEEGDSLRMRLLSRVRFRLTTRLLEHGEVLFAREKGDAAPLDIPSFSGGIPIGAEEIYSRYVPFGPAYRSLLRVRITADGAGGELRAPEFPLEEGVGAMGSPFPLDGALHAACIHGQQEVDFIPFPVGFARREIFRGVTPGEQCRCGVVYTGEQEGELLYDLGIFDEHGRPCERVQGVRMRDVGLRKR